MEHDGDDNSGWPDELERAVGKNVRGLRESRGLSQQQLGSDLLAYHAGMHQTTVAKLEAGSKPLRLNEVAAIAAYFNVPIESLWDRTGATLNEGEETTLLRQINALLLELTKVDAEYAEAETDLAKANQAAHDALARDVTIRMRYEDLERRLVDLQRRQAVSHTFPEGASLQPKARRGRLVPTGRYRPIQKKRTTPPVARSRNEAD
jgi:transcriptional regulator with XRE-family HTH domain